MRNGRSLLRPHPTAPAIVAAALALGLLGRAREAGAITRCEVLDRAQAWVDDGVLYSQTAWYTDPTTGICCYRSDCSGLVSAAWGLPPPGHTTYSFAGGPWDDGVSYVISPGELQPGDALNDPAHHIMLYVSGNFASGWVEVYEEYNWGHPAVRRWRSIDTSQYLPIRYVNIEPCCTPSAEVCNGRDDDCDGSVDEGVTRACGSDVGDCRRGTERCDRGAWGGCEGDVGPSSELCDGRDNDCDGATDEALARACGTDVGECARGVETCHAGAWGACTGGIDPVPERCDRLDNDCDGAADEELARSCGTDVGECVAGTERCADGAWGACAGAVWPAPEVCDRLDNDCDGASDDEQVCEIEEVRLQAPLHDRTTDVDGDGLPDLCGRAEARFQCFRGTGHGFGQAFPALALPAGLDGEDLASGATLRLGDLDGDGRADLCGRTPDGVRCWRSSGSHFDVALGGPPLAGARGLEGPAYATTLRLADLDGDGRDDLCGREPEGFRCYPSTDAGFGPPVTLAALSDAAGWSAVERYGTIRTGDVDGDGRADVCARGADGMACWRGEAAGFHERLEGPRWRDDEGWDRYERWSTIRLADVDGDGRDDLCARGADGFRCHLSTGAGFDAAVPGPPLTDAAGWGERAHFSTIRMGDVDADGAADLCARSATGMTCWLWTGMGFGRRIDGPALADASGWADPAAYRTLRLADLDGDGRADLAARDPAGLSAWPSDGHGFPTRLLGPALGDAEGWGEGGRALSLRLASPGAGAGGPGRADDAALAPAFEGGCAVAAGGGAAGATGPGGTAPARPCPPLLVLLLALAAGARATWRTRPRRTGSR